MARKSDEITRVLRLAEQAKNFDASGVQRTQRSPAGVSAPDEGMLGSSGGMSSGDSGTGATSVRRAPPLSVKKLAGAATTGQPAAPPPGPTVTGVPVKDNWSKSGYPTAGSAETTLRQRHSPGGSPTRRRSPNSSPPRSVSPVANPSGKLTKAQAAPVAAPIYQRPPPTAVASGSPPRERLGPGPRLSSKIATVAEHVAEGASDTSSPSGESNITTMYGGYRAGGSPRNADTPASSAPGAGNPVARSAQGAPVGRRLSGGRQTLNPTSNPAAGAAQGTPLGGPAAADRGFSGDKSGSSNGTNADGQSGTPPANRLRAGSSPAMGGFKPGGRAVGDEQINGGRPSVSATRSMSADGGGGMADYTSKREQELARVSESGGSGGVSGIGGMGGIPGGSGSHPVDTYSNPSTDDEDFDTPTAGNTPASSAGGVRGGFNTPPRGASPGVNTEGSSSPETPPNGGTNNGPTHNPGTPTTPFAAPEAAGGRSPNAAGFRTPSGGTTPGHQRSESAPFSPGRSDASSSLFSAPSNPGGPQGSGNFGAGGPGAGAVGAPNRFAPKMSGISEASLPPGAIHEEHHDHHHWNTRTHVPPTPIMGEGGVPIGSHTYSRTGSGFQSEDFATSRYDSAAAPGQTASVQEMPVSANVPQTAFSGPAASGSMPPSPMRGMPSSPMASGPTSPMARGPPSPMARGPPSPMAGMPPGVRQVSTGPVVSEHGTRPIFNEQGAPVGSHSYSHTGTGPRPVHNEQRAGPVFSEGGAPIGSQSFSRSAVGSKSEGFTHDAIGPNSGGVPQERAAQPMSPQQRIPQPMPPNSGGFPQGRNAQPMPPNSGESTQGRSTQGRAAQQMPPNSGGFTQDRMAQPLPPPITAPYIRSGQTGRMHRVPYSITNPAPPPNVGGSGGSAAGTPTAAMGAMNMRGQQGGQPFVHHEHHDAAAGPGSPIARFNGQQEAARPGSNGGRPDFGPMQGMQPMQPSASGSMRGIGNGMSGMPAGGMSPGGSMSMQSGGGGGNMPMQSDGMSAPGMGPMGGMPAGGMGSGGAMPMQQRAGGMSPPAMRGMGAMGGMRPAMGMGSGGRGMNNGGSTSSAPTSAASSASGDGAAADAGSRRGFSSFSSFTPIGAVAPAAVRSATASG